MKKDYKEKIRKLLALAESPNENEAKAALLKARELMAEHKLTEADCKEAEKRKTKEIITDYTCSKRRDPWLNALATIIADNHSCIAFFCKRPGGQTNIVAFIGIEEDVELCSQIFDYATKCVYARIKELKKEFEKFSAEFRTNKCNGYGYGFVIGLGRMYINQNKEASRAAGESSKGFELMTMVPKEVEEATQDFKKEKGYHDNQNINALSYIEGYHDGQNFNPAERINHG